jgi:hypothetical protein
MISEVFSYGFYLDALVFSLLLVGKMQKTTNLAFPCVFIVLSGNGHFGKEIKPQIEIWRKSRNDFIGGIMIPSIICSNDWWYILTVPNGAAFTC